MTRAAKRDYEGLLKFIQSYNLNSVVDDIKFQGELAFIHKKYYALLSIYSEFYHKGVCLGPNVNTRQKELFHVYLAEALSELGTSIFLWIHGGIKASKIVSRSSIENFIRAIALLDDLSVAEKKFSFEIFELAGSTRLASPNLTSTFTYLRSQYSKLSAYVHTSEDVARKSLVVLGFFPNSPEESQREQAAKELSDLANHYLEALVVLFSGFIGKMHYTNRDIVFDALKKSFIKKIEPKR